MNDWIFFIIAVVISVALIVGINILVAKDVEKNRQNKIEYCESIGGVYWHNGWSADCIFNNKEK